jgi:hypothetical protein
MSVDFFAQHADRHDTSVLRAQTSEIFYCPVIASNISAAIAVRRVAIAETHLVGSSTSLNSPKIAKQVHFDRFVVKAFLKSIVCEQGTYKRFMTD